VCKGGGGGSDGAQQLRLPKIQHFASTPGRRPGPATRVRALSRDQVAARFKRFLTYWLQDSSLKRPIWTITSGCNTSISSALNLYERAKNPPCSMRRICVGACPNWNLQPHLSNDSTSKIHPPQLCPSCNFPVSCSKESVAIFCFNRLACSERKNRL
jgi:hypothetical protein